MNKPTKGIVVDGACSGTPGRGEYRAINLESGEVIFHYAFECTTNNLMEFCGLVQALKHCKENEIGVPVYSDSQTAIIWAKNKYCGTKLEYNKETAIMHEFVKRCVKWLKDNGDHKPEKWITKQWGEIPADFGRKNVL